MVEFIFPYKITRHDIVKLGGFSYETESMSQMPVSKRFFNGSWRPDHDTIYLRKRSKFYASQPRHGLAVLLPAEILHRAEAKKTMVAGQGRLEPENKEKDWEDKSHAERMKIIDEALSRLKKLNEKQKGERNGEQFKRGEVLK